MTGSDLDALRGLTLITLHWDERAAEVSGMFEGPLRSPYRAAEPDHDHVRLRLSLTGVTGFEVSGWSHEPVDVTVTPSPCGIEVTFTGPGTSVRCLAAASGIVGISTFRAGPR